MLFCHVTSHIEGDPNDDLFEKKGGGGYPTMLMLDETGDMIGKHSGERTVPEFEKTVAKAVLYLAVRKKAEAGDKSAGIDLAIAKVELGTLTADDAKKKIGELGTPTPEQQVRFDAVLLNQEVMAISKSAGQDRASAGKKFSEMKAAGKIPTGANEYLTFWDTITVYAEAQNDVPMFEEALAKVREKIGANPSKKKYFDTKEAALKKMKSKK
ncbi:MAG: hypothetical protein FD180_842 [Planctomycetota bacterium]|nr:MAG: hypothetical protein FD180_842 [Planctomycetota bacterium]